MDNKTPTTLSAYADANRLLRAQRDELAAALLDLLNEIGDCSLMPSLEGIEYCRECGWFHEPIVRARAALAKVEGK